MVYSTQNLKSKFEIFGRALLLTRVASLSIVSEIRFASVSFVERFNVQDDLVLALKNWCHVVESERRCHVIEMAKNRIISRRCQRLLRSLLTPAIVILLILLYRELQLNTQDVDLSAREYVNYMGMFHRILHRLPYYIVYIII